MYRKDNISNNYFFRKARRSVGLMKKIEQVSRKEIDDSWNAVEQILQASEQEKIKKTRYRLVWTSVAAMLVLGAAVFSTLYLIPSESSLVAALHESSMLADSTTEISLITSSNHLKLEDESVLNYDSNGKVSINKQQVQSVRNVDAAKNEKELNHIIVPKGRRMNITFEDGTKIYVNAGSHVIYPAVFDKKKREIAVEGEVYLDVARDPKRPFIVKTGKFDVKVLGTVFNVTAYKEDKSASVVLVKGCVEVETNTKEKVMMSPDQRVSITDGKTSTEKVNVFKYICWKDNLMYLKNDRTGDVLNRVARYYGVNIRYDEQVADIPISGKLDLRGDINSVLDVIEESVSVKLVCDSSGGFHLSLK